jgi:hypothetical protein
MPRAQGVFGAQDAWSVRSFQCFDEVPFQIGRASNVSEFVRQIFMIPGLDNKGNASETLR